MPIAHFLSKQPCKVAPLYGLSHDTAGEETPKTRKWLSVLLFITLFLSAYYFLVFNKALVNIELETDTQAMLRIYWPDSEGKISEKRMAGIVIKPGQTRYKIRIGNALDINSLRLVPSDKTARITIKRLGVKQWGFPDFLLETAAEFENLKVVAGVASFTRLEQGGVIVGITSRTPQLKLLFPTLVELDLETDTPTILKLYWPDSKGEINEQHAAAIPIKPGKNTYKINIGNISGKDYLRIDPSEQAARVTLKRLVIKQWGFPDFQLKTAAEFDKLTMLTGVESLSRQEHGVIIQVKGNDPQLKLRLPTSGNRYIFFHEFGRIAAIILLAAGCFFVFPPFFKGSSFIPVLAAFALALILVMAGISAFNKHPDEVVHVAAGEYYENHTLPPRVGDEAIAQTYSLYGMSRLHSGEIVYLLAGKFLKFFQPFHLDSFLLLRLFNVLLFTLLVLFAFNKVNFRFFLLPFLLSPQIWYVFSYFNSDAFATFICILAAYQLAAKESAFTAMMSGKKSTYSWAAPVLLGILFALLLMQKLNFYFLYVFFFFYFIWKLRVEKYAWTPETIRRFMAVVVIGCSVFIVFKGTDAWVNDFNKKALVLEAREKYAAPLFKPSTPLNKKHAYLQIRERGTTLQKFLQDRQWRWGAKTFLSSFGVYGYTSILAPLTYYDYVRVIALLLLSSLVLSIVCRGGLSGITLLGITVGSVLFLFAGLIYHAWTYDFQAQGRYLLPIIPMLAILVYHCQRILIRPLFFSLFFMLFILSTYNFIFVGLQNIGKYYAL